VIAGVTFRYRTIFIAPAFLNSPASR
jgi:hypothetical protein